MRSPSENSRCKKAWVSPTVEGPPIFINTTPVLAAEVELKRINCKGLNDLSIAEELKEKCGNVEMVTLSI